MSAQTEEAGLRSMNVGQLSGATAIALATPEFAEAPRTPPMLRRQLLPSIKSEYVKHKRRHERQFAFSQIPFVLPRDQSDNKMEVD